LDCCRGQSNTQFVDLNARGSATLTSSLKYVTNALLLPNRAVDLTLALGALRSPAGLAGLNDRDEVLAFHPADSVAVLWRAGRPAVVRVVTPDWRLDSVSALNDAGQIAGHAVNVRTGAKAAVLLTPVR
jgi:hypothetical protein